MTIPTSTSNPPSTTASPRMASHQRMACLWLPNWPIQRLVVAEPELRCQRLVLFRRDSRRGRLISAVSPLAQRDGIRAGMPISRVETGGCYLREQDSTADRQALEELAERMHEFSPLVGIESMDEKSGHSSGHSGSAKQTAAAWQPSSILLDLTGIGRLFGGEDTLSQQLFDRVQNLGYLPRLAVADTIGGAWAISHFGTTGWSVIPQGDHQAWGALPLAALRLSAPTVSILQQLGLQQVAQILQLPREQLAMRFGDEIHRRLDQALGTRLEPLQAHRPAVDFSATQSLEYPLTHRETIEVIIARMAEEVCQQLRSRQQASQQWSIHLIGAEQDFLRISVGLFQATSNEQELMPLVQMQLDQQLQRANRFGQLPLAVEEIQMRATSVVLMVRYQRQLFDDSPNMDQQSLADLINRLSNRLGQQQVLAARLRSGAQPEFAFEYRPLIDRQNSKKKRANQSVHVAGRPLRILNPALPIKVVMIQQLASNCSLQEFRTEKQVFKILKGWGPERIETGWWRGPMVAREYWRIEVASGQQFWLYQNLRDQSWFLQGEF